MINWADLQLKNPEKEDMSFLVKWINEKATLSAKQSRKKTTIQEQLKKLHSTSNYNLYIISDKDNRIGICEIYQIDLINRNCFINLFFEDKTENASHYGSKTLLAILNYLFQTMGLEKVSSNIIAEDIVMVTLFKTFGFQTDVRKRHHYFSNGVFKNVLEMSILNSEYLQKVSK